MRHSLARRLTHILFAVLALSLSGTLAAQFTTAYPPALSGGNYMHNFYFPPAPSSTPWAPAWSPDGKWLAFAMQGSIWKVAPGGGAAFELTHGKTYHSSPDWSPDGRWIVYTADHDREHIQLEVLDTRSGETRALTDDAAIYTDPVFSPDGRRIAYVSTLPNGYFNVYIRAFDNGRWSGEPVAVSRDNDFGSDRLYFGPWDMHITPAWLPDGSELLLLSNRGVPLGSGNVLRVPASEDGILSARTVLAEQTLYRTRPDVSIDGKRFVYTSTSGAADQYNNLYLQPTVGGEPYKITFFAHDAFHPRWSPDGEQIAFVSNAPGVSQLMLLETYGGKLTPVNIGERVYRRPVGKLRVMVVDAESENPMPNRVHLTAADGKFYAPDTTYARQGNQGDAVFHNSGRFEVTLPAGRAELMVVRGFEYQPRRFEVDITADQTAELTVKLGRIADMAAEGWYSASTHVHANYGGNLHNTLENLKMMSRAEDQDLVLEQVANKDNRILDHHYFVPGGGAHPASDPDQIVVVGQEYRPPFYGHVFMFGLEEHLISPFVTGYEGTAIESLYPSNTDMFVKARAQGAVTGYVHPFLGDKDPIDEDLGYGRGFIVDAALGTSDALEWSDAQRAGFYPLYAVWNNGLKVTATGGEDSISSLHRSKLVGSMRTYVYTGDRGLSMEAWFDGLKQGHAFATSGPLLQFSINGAIPGETVELPAGGGSVTVSGTLRSITAVGRVLLYCNGELVKTFPLSGSATHLELTHPLDVQHSGWCHLRAEGSPANRFPLDMEYAQALTNPVWLQVGDEAIRDDASADYALAWIDRLEEMARAWPGWRSEAEQQHVFEQFEQARQVYRDKKQ
ncbi:MAG: CehA/McbA family metallohydrolase [Xanthomonadales bacterium]|nr:CehA/McbA family metallohydrolase [Xanthomonadales bacterium]